MKKLILLCAFFMLIYLNECSCEDQNGILTVIGSKVMRLNTKYHVVVSSKNIKNPEQVEIGIFNTPERSGHFEISKNITVSDVKQEYVEFDLKGLPNSDYSLRVKSDSLNLSEIVKLQVNPKTVSVFVQTDKSIYKPADKINFRVLALNSEMRPIGTAKIDVFVTDDSKNRIKRFENVELTKGVYEGFLQLSDLPVMGQWKIHVMCNGKEEIAKPFEVSEYTLPKFEVVLDIDEHPNYEEGKIRASVSAKYTFGKKAKGNATVIAKVPNHYNNQLRKYESTIVEKTVEVNGNEPIEFDIKDELKIEYKYQEKSVDFTAKFKEELTGREMNVTKTVKIHVTPHIIKLAKVTDNFKPGLPFKISCYVMKHEKNAPVTDDRNPLKIKIDYQFEIVKKCNKKIFEDGLEKIIEEVDCRSKQYHSETQEIFLQNGFHEVNLNLTSNMTRITLEARYLMTTTSVTSDKLESESGKYIQIVQSDKKWRLSDKIKIDVMSTEPLTELNYQVIAKGDIALSRQLKLQNVTNHQIAFTPNSSIAPKSKILVFYLASNGEIISDLSEIEFENELENFVNIQLSRSEAKPGDNVTILISSNPNSFIGILGVDQSVQLLKNDNDIQESTVFEEMKKFDTKYHRDKEYNRWGHLNRIIKNKLNFDNSNTFIITNVKTKPRQADIPYDYEFGYVRRLNNVFDDDIGGYAMSLNGPMLSMINSHNRVDYIMPTMSQRNDNSKKGSSSKKSQQNSKLIEIRKEFPETWLFESFDFDPKSSQVNLTKKVPDTITSWLITGFAVDPLTGLGLTKTQSRVKVFQPFFVTTNLPYSIKRGEVATIPVIVFNYLDYDQQVEVTLFNNDVEFEFTEVNEQENNVKRRRRQLELKRSKSVFIKSQEGVTIPFMVRALKVGHIKIKVTASSSIAGDGLERLLIVEPEGVTRFMNEAMLVDLVNGEEKKFNFNITIPSNAVPDSTKIEVSAVGDIMGNSIENLDKLIKLPYGCGEQNMLNFVPNIVALDYLIVTNKLSSETELKAKGHLETGYQRELTYKHADGSYSAFGGGGDSKGSTWLTAFVAKSFHQAKKYTQIDQEIIDQALSYLAGVQDENGEFPERGTVFHKSMQGGASKGIALTAYTLITFLENSDAKTKYQNNILKALNYLKSNLDSAKDNYSMAIRAYALAMADDPLKQQVMQELNKRAVKEKGFIYWKKESSEQDKKNIWSSQSNSLNVEMSAYILQAMLLEGKIVGALPTMRWLISQSNENGGFQSTQDTVVGMQALAKIASKFQSNNNNNIEIDFQSDAGTSLKLTLNSDNRLYLQKHRISSESRKFEVVARGEGVGIVQVAYRYNVDMNGEWPRFNLDPQLHENSNKNFLHLISCASYIADDKSSVSNMAVMEVELPSGFVFDVDTKDELKSTKNVKKIETEQSNTKVIIYFDNIGTENICPEIKAYREHSVAKQKRVAVKVYDYYDNSQKATTFYNPPEISLCDICDGAEECKEHCEVQEIEVEQI